jgi:hypothetical protein
MVGSSGIVGLTALGLATAVCAPAFGQNAPKAIAAAQSTSQPAARPASASAKGQTPASPKLTNSWICASGMRLEIYPVSFDDPAATPQYVVVYRQDGDVVASERIDARIARLFPAYGCNDRDMRDRSDLLG